MAEFPAHIAGKRIQSVHEHCRNTAAYSADNLRAVGLEKTGYLSGLIHDMGKSTSDFRTYIEAAAGGEFVQRGSVNHTFAGVRYLLTDILTDDEQRDFCAVMTANLIAYAIGAHHGQFDCVDEDGNNGFDHRLESKNVKYEETVGNFFTDDIQKEDIRSLFCQSKIEVFKYLDMIKDLSIKGNKPDVVCACFFFGALVRLIQSALIDADRRDTAEFMQGEKFLPNLTGETEVWSKELNYAEDKMAAFDRTSEINRARTFISDRCKAAAAQASGLFRLNVPTGGGKTISSIRFALAHARKWKKKRIIFTAPLLSILEQNAAVIREYIYDQSIILEHHSNAVQPETDGEKLNISELLTENWDSPVIITSLVQLLDTFFAGRTSNIRRFHALSDAIIVIDEVQTVPGNILSLFNLMVSFLVRCCKTSVILCSATQPPLEDTEYPLLVQAIDIVPYDPKLWEPFRRTVIKPAGKAALEALPERVQELVGDAASVLIICNKKSECDSIYQVLKDRYKSCYHLSASMCMEHRRQVLSEVKTSLSVKREGQVICVSTQVIEAGVDISFAKVIRLMAGMDSIVQAAGRCNRNGELKHPGQVAVLDCSNEDLAMLTDISRGKHAAQDLFYSYQTEPDVFEQDLASNEAVSYYYHSLYNSLPENEQDYYVDSLHTTILSMLSTNKDFHGKNDNYLLHQAFKTAGKAFHVFDDDTFDVIVPFQKGREIISDLFSLKADYDPGYVRQVLKQARGYTVTLYPYQKRMLEKQHAIEKCKQVDVWFLSDGYYDEETGVTLEGKTESYLEV